MAAVAAILLFVPPAQAAAPVALFAAPATRDPWNIDWLSVNDGAAPLVIRGALIAATSLAQSPNNQPTHAAAIEHSDAYLVRAKIHKYASFATIPVFAAELALGQSVYNASDDGGNYKGLHATVGVGIISLFAVNGVTGMWNLLGEDRRLKKGRALQSTHSLLMLAANGGFIATWATAPDGDDRGARSTHRTIAIASIGVGTVGYLLMLFGN
jgi:hypothetical protein